MRKRKTHTHRPMQAFKVGKEWRCCSCGTLGAWSADWGYFGALGCRKCGIEPAIDWVACSDACREKFHKGHDSVNHMLEQTTRQKSAEQIETRITALHSQIARLQEQKRQLSTPEPSK